MKKTFIYIVAVIAIAFFSCKKYTGDSYDFSNKAPNYMSFSTASVSRKTLNSKVNASNVYLSDTATASIVTRVSFQKTVNYKITYKVDNYQSFDVNGVYPVNAITSSLKLFTTDNMFPAGKDSITGQIVLVGAMLNGGDSLQIGYPTTKDLVSIPFKAYRPGATKPK